MKNLEKELAMQRVKVLQETKEKLTEDINYLVNFPNQNKEISKKCEEIYKNLKDAFDDAIIFEAKIILNIYEGVKNET